MGKIVFYLLIIISLGGCKSLDISSIKEGEPTSKYKIMMARSKFNNNLVEGDSVYLNRSYYSEGHSKNNNFNFKYITLGEWEKIDYFGKRDMKYKISNEKIDNINLKKEIILNKSIYGINTLKKDGEVSVYPMVYKSRNDKDMNFTKGKDEEGDEYRLIYGIPPKNNDYRKQNKYFIVNMSKLERKKNEIEKDIEIRKQYNERVKKYEKLGYSNFIAMHYASNYGKNINGQKKYKDISYGTFEAGLKSDMTIDKYVDSVFKYTKLKSLTNIELGDFKNLNPYNIKGKTKRVYLNKPFQLINKKSALYLIDGVVIRIDFPNSSVIYGNGRSYNKRESDLVTLYGVEPYKYITSSFSNKIVPRFIVVK